MLRPLQIVCDDRTCAAEDEFATSRVASAFRVQEILLLAMVNYRDKGRYVSSVFVKLSHQKKASARVFLTCSASQHTHARPCNIRPRLCSRLFDLLHQIKPGGATG